MSSLSRTVALMTAALLGVVTVTQAAAPIPTATGNATHDRIARFSPAERNLAFDRLLRSVDHADCDVVESTFLEYRSGSFASWRAICSDGRHFVLDLVDGSDGTVAVRACDTTGEKKMRGERWPLRPSRSGWRQSGPLSRVPRPNTQSFTIFRPPTQSCSARAVPTLTGFFARRHPSG